jgi:hypothetical protein
MLVPKYVIILIVYSTLNFDQHSDIMVVHRKSSVSAQPKPTSAQVTTPKTATPAAATSSSAGGTVWTILSIADAWDSSRRVTEFLENLKNREVDREGILFLNSLTLLTDSWLHYPAVLAAQLSASQEALSKEQSA